MQADAARASKSARSRMPDAVVEAVSQEQLVPVAPPPANSVRSSRPARPFSTLLLAPAAQLSPRRAQAEERVISSWGRLVPGGALVTRQLVPATPCARQPGAPVLLRSDEGRYFGTAAATRQAQHAGASMNEQQAWQGAWEQHLADRPDDELGWLQYALQVAAAASASVAGPLDIGKGARAPACDAVRQPAMPRLHAHPPFVCWRACAPQARSSRCCWCSSAAWSATATRRCCGHCTCTCTASSQARWPCTLRRRQQRRGALGKHAA